MNDPARDYADEVLDGLAERIKREYSEALERASVEEFALLSHYEGTLREMERLLDEGKVTQKKVDAWKAQEAAKAVRAQGIVDQLAVRANASNQAAANMVADELPGVFAEGANWSAYDVGRQAGALNAFSLVNEDAVRRLMLEDPDLLPPVTVDKKKDVAWNRQKFASAITQGILTGDSIPRIAARVGDVLKMDERHATMLARTAVTSAENGGKLHTHDRARAMGIDVTDVWVATLDSRTRDSHILMHGEEKPRGGDVFSNGLRFPGDPNGPVEEVANCRCALVGQVAGFAKRDYTKVDGTIDGLTYEQWRAAARERLGGKQDGGGEEQKRTVPDIGTAPVRPKASDFEDPDELDAARTAYRADREAFESRRQELVDEIASQPGHGYGTREEVMSWADRRGVTVTEEVLDAVDSRTMDEIVDVSDRLMEKYPEVLQSFESVGGKYVIGLSDDRYVFMEAGGGLHLNPSYFSDYRSVVDHVVESYTRAAYNDKVGRTLTEIVRGDGTFRTSVTHEFGHNLDSTIRYNLDAGSYSEYVSELMDLTRKYTTSEYATFNDLEAFAEGFAEMECNPTSDYATAFADFLRRWR